MSESAVMSTVPGGVADAPPPPPPMQAPSMKSMGDSKIPDASAVMKLTSLKSLRLHQSRAVLEAATGGAWPNKYIVCDHDLPYQPMRQGQPHGDAKPTPIMIIEEESGLLLRGLLLQVLLQPQAPRAAQVLARHPALRG